MGKLLFVCYNHGCRGERLATKISRHDKFQTLDADSAGDRTIIKNDHFDKQFLKSSLPQVSVTGLPESHIVVPSHFFYDRLSQHYPDALYLAIDNPKDIQAFRRSLYERFWQYSTNNTAELMGECESRLNDYRPGATKEEVGKFVRQVLQHKGITFGDIRCMAMGIEPTVQNKMLLLQRQTPEPLSLETRANSLVVPYEDVNKVDVEYVVSYFKKSSGSL